MLSQELVELASWPDDALLDSLTSDYRESLGLCRIKVEGCDEQQPAEAIALGTEILVPDLLLESWKTRP
jgi:hypothetical protein